MRVIRLLHKLPHMAAIFAPLGSAVMKQNETPETAIRRARKLNLRSMGPALYAALPQPAKNAIRQLSLRKAFRWLAAPLAIRYQPNPWAIEIDITHRCQLSCLHCNRSCGLAASREDMSREQIEKFVRESKEQGRQWKEIVVLGGEPTLHPHFAELMQVLIEYKRNVSPRTRLMVKSNGCGSKVCRLLGELPPDVEVENSEKQGDFHDHFESFNIAPVDLPQYASADYTSGCPLGARFGIGLTRTGYYPCAVAAGIDRVMGFNIGRSVLPSVSDKMEDQMQALCRFCGHFKREVATPSELHEISPSWKSAYSAYEKNRPVLTTY